MKLIKLGNNNDSKYVLLLCKLLGEDPVNIYDEYLKSKVINFQKSNNLVPDGIVGPKTWLHLLEEFRLKSSQSLDILESDYVWAADYLGCEPAALKSVVKVETGDRKGFVSPGKPTILFEGHIFWKQLNKKGLDPCKLSKGNEDILYSKWTKKYYLGGEKEYDRFNRAIAIDREAAICSTSFGLFQVMGFNYNLCSCESAEELYERMCHSEFKQFVSGVEFIRVSGCQDSLCKKDWDEFARRYNGPGYKENRYDEKLNKYYLKYVNC